MILLLSSCRPHASTLCRLVSLTTPVHLIMHVKLVRLRGSSAGKADACKSASVGHCNL